MVTKKSPCAVPIADLHVTMSSTPPYSLRKATRAFPFYWIGTLHTMTLILLEPLYSSWSRECSEDMLLPASFVASSSDGSKTPQVAKLLLQKYLTGILAAFRNSSKVSFLILVSFLVFRSVTIKESVFGWTASTYSGIGSILFPWEYWAYLALSLA